MTVSVLVATIGRPTLERTIQSIQSQALPGDEVIVIGATQAIADRAAASGCAFVYAPPGRNWGGSERSAGMQYAHGDYVSFMDDDDVYLPGARAAMEDAMSTGKPTIFKMRIGHSGGELWTDPVLTMGNVGTPMMFLPNDGRTKSGQWDQRYGNDFRYLQSLQLQPEDIAWRPEVIALVRPR